MLRRRKPGVRQPISGTVLTFPAVSDTASPPVAETPSGRWVMFSPSGALPPEDMRPCPVVSLENTDLDDPFGGRNVLFMACSSAEVDTAQSLDANSSGSVLMWPWGLSEASANRSTLPLFRPTDYKVTEQQLDDALAIGRTPPTPHDKAAAAAEEQLTQQGITFN